jgi:hypothetical protein
MTGEFSREQAPRNQPLAAVPRAGHLMLGLFIALRDVHQACLRPPRSTLAKNEESPERCWVWRFRRLAIRAARFNYYLPTRFALIAAFCCLAEVTSPVEWMGKLVRGWGLKLHPYSQVLQQQRHGAAALFQLEPNGAEHRRLS